MKNEITAKRLSLALSNANLKPQELADRSGVSKSSISQYVNGSHAPSNISSGKMAKVLNVSPLWLMGFDVEMTTTQSVTNYYLEQQFNSQILYKLKPLHDKLLTLDFSTQEQIINETNRYATFLIKNVQESLQQDISPTGIPNDLESRKVVEDKDADILGRAKGAS